MFSYPVTIRIDYFSSGIGVEYIQGSKSAHDSKTTWGIFASSSGCDTIDHHRLCHLNPEYRVLKLRSELTVPSEPGSPYTLPFRSIATIRLRWTSCTAFILKPEQRGAFDSAQK